MNGGHDEGVESTNGKSLRGLNEWRCENMYRETDVTGKRGDIDRLCQFPVKEVLQRRLDWSHPTDTTGDDSLKGCEWGRKRGDITE